MPPRGSDAERQYQLVRKAITELGVFGVEWEDPARERAMRLPEFQGIMPDHLRRLAIDFVVGGGNIRQVRETAEEWLARRGYDYYYCISFDVDFLEDQVFMKFCLEDADDENHPVVYIIGAHRSSR